MKKNLLYFLLLAILFACKTTKKTPYYSNPSALFDKEKFAKNPERWDFYIHDAEGSTYSTRSKSIDTSSFEAVIEKTYPIEIPEALKRTESKRKKEVHVYVKDSSINTLQRTKIQEKDVVEVVSFVNPENLQKRGNESGEKAFWSVFLTVILFIVGGILALMLAIYLTITAFFDWLTGCYIATMAYGSYDAPEVKILRRFRDEKLKKSFAGRVFIANYYAFSPLLVKIFKPMGGINRIIRKRLDRFVIRLKAKNGW